MDHKAAPPRLRWTALLLLTGCMGIQRDCASFQASEVDGADWIVVQYAYDGVPINCWRLAKTGISNEGHSDGIFWLDTKTGHLVHISGWYNRVQVSGGDYASAARSVGIDLQRCSDGRYVDAPKEPSK